MSNRYHAARVLLPISSELLNSSTIQERTVLAIRQSKRRRAPDAPKDVRRHDTLGLPRLRVRPQQLQSHAMGDDDSLCTRGEVSDSGVRRRRDELHR